MSNQKGVSEQTRKFMALYMQLTDEHKQMVREMLLKLHAESVAKEGRGHES